MSVSMLLMAGALFTVSACKENISEDNYAIAQKKTVEDYLGAIDSLSSIKQIFGEVKLGLSDNASVIGSALAARGNYTVFAPSNKAIAAYVLKVTNGVTTDIDSLKYDQKKAIALNCVIDNGSNNAYELADFPNNGMFAITNLRDRRISCKQNTDGSVT